MASGEGKSAAEPRSPLSSARPRVPRPVPTLQGASGRHSAYSSNEPTAKSARASAQYGGSQDAQLEQLQAKNGVLRQELDSLREMYAKHNAYSELKVDRVLREKDQECAEWYKGKQLQIKQMQAAVVIMNSLYEKKRRHIHAEMKADREYFLGKEEESKMHVLQLEEERRMEAKQYKEQLESTNKQHSEEMAEVKRQKSDIEAKANRLSDQLAEARNEVDRLKEANKTANDALKINEARLAEALKNITLDNRDEQIRSLQEELETTRRTLKERWKREVESLRQELMDYVRFIVHILPDNWAETEAFDKVPSELKEQLAWMSTSPADVAKAHIQSPKSPRKGNQAKGFLPPADILAKGASLGGGGQHARSAGPGAHPTRKRGMDGIDMSL